ncbi:hypothetical protein [Granulicella sp. L46]|uniref:hypothetical protein n=1 Tax=Granulicella sp. L46 TaxID=1641865 RepID=UPI00131BA3FA|nr:hypothetical protein [Granulicella sp. L46]
MKCSLLIVLFTLLLAVSPTHSQSARHGTTFAVERTPALVAIAIDSSSSTVDAATSKEIQNGPICKVHISSAVVFVIAGIYNYDSHKHRVFDVSKTVGSILASKGSWQQKEPVMIAALTTGLGTALASKGVSSKFPEGSSVLQVAMAGADSKVPYLHAIEFIVHYEGNKGFLFPKIVSCPGICPTGYKNITLKPPAMRMTGHAVDDTTGKVESDIVNEENVATKEHRDSELMGPVQVATVDSDGDFRWVRRPAFCPMVPND